MVASTTKQEKQDAPLTLRVMNPVPAAEPVALPAAEPVVLPAAEPVAVPEPGDAVTEVVKDAVPDDRPAPARKSKSKSKSKSKKNNGSVDFSKGSRGIDTLLRNAYRAQLDMLALAATKANIMISLNGLLMSMLIIAGTHLISINGMYVVPIGIFLATCAIATTFAVFAARPEISRTKYNYGDFMRDEARLMLFEEFSDLRESEYIDAMTVMLSDPARTYRSMLAHIHELGLNADKKYQHLYYSYTAFMTGTIITVISLFILAALRWMGFMTLA